jgi:hypothetical protein
MLAQQVGPAQEGRIGRRGAAQHEVVAAAGAGVAAVDHEFFGRQARFVGRVVQEGGLLDQAAPAVGRLDVDLDHPRIGRDPETGQARIARRLVAFQQHRHPHFLSGGLHGGDQLEVVLEFGHRRHEDVQAAIARLGAHRGAGDRAGRFELAGRSGLAGQMADRFARRAGTAGLLPRSAARKRGRDARPLARRRRADGAHAGLGHRGAAGGLHELHQVPRRRQRPERTRQVGRDDIRIVRRLDPGMGIERQPIAQRRIAGQQVAAPGAQVPPGAAPARPCPFGAGDRQHAAGDRVQALGDVRAPAGRRAGNRRGRR